MLWTVHPLQTESVTYIVQRAESLAGLFYLLVLYAVIGGVRSSHAAWWYILAVVACFLGVGVKEPVVTAPIVVLLYDRTFLEDSFGKLLRRRWGLYLGLFASWGFLIYLQTKTGLPVLKEQVGSIGFWAYLRSQPGVILHYLRLSLWPDSLCLSYEWPVAQKLGDILPGVLALGVIGAATLWGVIKRQEWGFQGAWFLLILAPTSSVMPLRQLAFEHRMYLSLAAVVTLVVLLGYAAGKSLVCRKWVGGRVALASGLIAAVLGTVVLGILTFRRNADYHSELSIWEDTLAKAPQNPESHYNAANALMSLGRNAEAIEHFEQALRLKPDHASAHNNYGLVLANLGRIEDAIVHYRRVLEIKPNNPATGNNLGLALASLGRTEEAIDAYRKGLEVDSNLTYPLHCNLGVALGMAGRKAEAIEEYQRAIQADPEVPLAYHNLAIRLAEAGRVVEAIHHYQQALRLNPGYADSRLNLGIVLANADRITEAIEQFEEGLRIDPDDVRFRFNLGITWLRMGRHREAIGQLGRAIGEMPDHVKIHCALAWLLATQETSEGGDPPRAVELAERACSLSRRHDAVCLDALAAAYAAAGRFADAVATASEARRLAESTAQASLAQEIHMRLQLYRDGKPCREPSGRVSKPRG